MLHMALCCLEGSTMSNLVHRRRRCARIVPYMILLPGGQYARGQGFILVYRLAMDARPCGVMVWLAENIQACLRDFQTGTASMAHKRHLASTARGFCGFCLMTHMSTLMRDPSRTQSIASALANVCRKDAFIQPFLQVRARPCKYVRLR